MFELSSADFTRPLKLSERWIAFFHLPKFTGELKVSVTEDPGLSGIINKRKCWTELNIRQDVHTYIYCPCFSTRGYKICEGTPWYIGGYHGTLVGTVVRWWVPWYIGGYRGTFKIVYMNTYNSTREKGGCIRMSPQHCRTSVLQ